MINVVVTVDIMVEQDLARAVAVDTAINIVEGDNDVDGSGQVVVIISA